jgi:hypothetical protein
MAPDFDDALDAVGDDDVAPLPDLPPCPFCDDAEGACEHTVGIAYEDPNECLSEFTEWDVLDEIAHEIERKAVDGAELLDGEAGRERTWWLTRRGAGGGLSKRMAPPAAVAKRSKFVFASAADDQTAPCALFAEDGEAARTRLSGALTRCVADAKRLAARLDVDV